MNQSDATVRWTVQRVKKSLNNGVIANQSADWCGNPFLKMFQFGQYLLYTTTIEIRIAPQAFPSVPRRFAPRNDILLLCIRFQGYTDFAVRDFYRLDIVKIDSTVEHIQGISVLNPKVKKGIFSDFVQDNEG